MEGGREGGREGRGLRSVFVYINLMDLIRFQTCAIIINYELVVS